MDILSHGLWGGIAFGRRNRPSFWLAFVIGLAPDLMSFGILYGAVTLGMADAPDFSRGTPPESSIPQYVHHLYNVTQLPCLPAGISTRVAPASTAIMGTGGVGSARPGRCAHALVCLLPDSSLLALKQLEI